MLRRILRSRGPLYVFAARRDVAERGEQLHFTDQAAAEAFLHRFLPSTSDAQTLRLMATELSHGVAAADDVAALRCVAAALVEDRVRVVRRYAPIDPASKAKRPDKLEKDLFEAIEAAKELLERDWIEIKLVDEAGNPVAGQRYSIVTPDGREHRGYTDSLGLARITRIPSGECQVSFPELDMKAWEPL